MNARIRNTLLKYLSVPAIVGLLLTLSSCGNSSAEAGDQTQKPEDVVNVSVEKVQESEFIDKLKLSGTIESFEDVNLSSEEGGKLIAWLLPRGARVSKGTVIARLDSSILKPTYDAALAQYKQADVTYQKQKKVYAQKAISELQLQTLEYQRDAAKAQMDLAKARYERTFLRSPINGVLNNRFYDEGEYVSPTAPVAHLVGVDRLKLSVGVPERYAGRLQLGDNVIFTVDAFPGKKFEGKITFVGAAVNPDNRTIPLEIVIGSAGGNLKPDMIADVNIELNAIENAIVIPSDYIQQVDLNKHVVYLAKNGVAVERKVTIASTSQGNAYITEGLSEGDQLITLGFQNVADGQKINVK